MGGERRASRGRGRGLALITTPMVALAFSVINCPSADGEDARLLARLVLEAADDGPAGPGRP